jgi:hypothetical protein
VRRALVAGAVVAASLAAVVPAAADDVVVRASVDRQSVGLGEPFDYRVEVHGATGMTVFADVAPFVAAAPPHRSRSDGGRVVRIEQRLICLDRACAPSKNARRVALPRVRVTGAGDVAPAAPVSITLVPRVPEAAVTASRARYRIDDHVHAARAPWGAAAGALIALATACLLGAAVLLLRSARPAPAMAGAQGGAPGGIAYALRMLRESARRPVPDRRRAADFVARAVGDGSTHSAADDARRLAWSAPEPQPPEVVALADRVETTRGSET